MDERNAVPCDVVHGREIPTGSSDFQLVLHQLHIHETWREAADKSVMSRDAGTRKENMDAQKTKKNKNKTKDSHAPVTDNKNASESRDRTNSFTKLKRFLNINSKPMPQSSNGPKNHAALGRQRHLSPDGHSPPCTSPRLTPTSPTSPPGPPRSPALIRTQLQVEEDYGFRERAHSDSSAMNPRHRKVTLAVEEQTSPLDHLHVHWPDEHQGEKLATTLRPRSYSHGSGERPARPILKKSSSRTVYY